MLGFDFKYRITCDTLQQFKDFSKADPGLMMRKEKKVRASLSVKV